MARPLRLEFAGALYHITSRGHAGADICLSDDDRAAWLNTLGAVCKRFNWLCHAYCLMTGHYQILVETPDANLSIGMRQLNGVHTQYFNRVHGCEGPVFQGRFKGILVDKDNYLLALARDIVLSPLHAKIVQRLEQWPWSSYRATCGQAAAPAWLYVDFLLSQFSARRSVAVTRYKRFVQEGRGLAGMRDQVRGQVYLGSDRFVQKMQSLANKKPPLTEVPRTQRRALKRALAEFERAYERDEAIARAYLSGQHTLAAIAEHFGLHFTTVSRLVKAYERSARGGV